MAANVQRLTQLTEVLARVSSNSIAHDLRHLRCGTTHSDDGTLSLEDLVAICDLGAGAFCEVATVMFAPIGFRCRFPTYLIFSGHFERRKMRTSPRRAQPSEKTGEKRKETARFRASDGARGSRPVVGNHGKPAFPRSGVAGGEIAPLR